MAVVGRGYAILESGKLHLKGLLAWFAWCLIEVAEGARRGTALRSAPAASPLAPPIGLPSWSSVAVSPTTKISGRPGIVRFRAVRFYVQPPARERWSQPGGPDNPSSSM